jgi:hypothetical protein
MDCRGKLVWEGRMGKKHFRSLGATPLESRLLALLGLVFAVLILGIIHHLVTIGR